MDSIVVEVAADGRVQLEGEELRAPTLQERRAIIYSATNEIAALTELLEILDPPGSPGTAAGSRPKR
jgi:hypothetical protein